MVWLWLISSSGGLFARFCTVTFTPSTPLYTRTQSSLETKPAVNRAEDESDWFFFLSTDIGWNLWATMKSCVCGSVCAPDEQLAPCPAASASSVVCVNRWMLACVVTLFEWWIRLENRYINAVHVHTTCCEGLICRRPCSVFFFFLNYCCFQSPSVMCSTAKKSNSLTSHLFQHSTSLVL